MLVNSRNPLIRRNKDQKSGRRFCDRLGKARTIAELTKERLRRASRQAQRRSIPDWRGRHWLSRVQARHLNIAPGTKPEDLEATLFDHQDHLLEGRSEADVLYELLLKLGLDLCVPDRKQRSIEQGRHRRRRWCVGLPAENINAAEVKAWPIASPPGTKQLAPIRLPPACSRQPLPSDVAKTNMAAILQQHGIATVRSL